MAYLNSVLKQNFFVVVVYSTGTNNNNKKNPILLYSLQR